MNIFRRKREFLKLADEILIREGYTTREKLNKIDEEIGRRHTKMFFIQAAIGLLMFIVAVFFAWLQQP